jgi:hypothetical protein
VLQEVSAGPQVVVTCGRVLFNWDMTGLAAEYITVWRDLFDALDFGKTNIWSAVSLRDRTLHEGAMLDTLSIARSICVTKSEDTIYALLSMPAFLKNEYPVRAEYRKSLAQVYQEVVEASFRNLRSIEILSSVQHERLGIMPGDVPSWAPMWNRDKISHILSAGLGDVPIDRNASDGLKFSYVIDPTDMILELPDVTSILCEKMCFSCRRSNMILLCRLGN